MAILQKRTSSKRLPSAGQRAPLNSVIQPKPRTSLATSPLISAKTTLPRTITTSGTNAPVANRPALSSITTSGTNKPVANRPVISPITSGAKITMPSNTATKSILNKAGSSGSNSVTSKLINTGANALIGAGTGALINKLFGKPVAKPNIGKPAEKPKAGEPSAGVAKPPPVVVAKTDEPVTSVIYDDNEPFDERGNLKEGWAENNEDGGYYRKLPTNKLDSKPVITPAVVASAATEPQLMEDVMGNVWTANADGGYTLYSSSEGPSNEETTFIDPNTDEVWNLAEDGKTWTTKSGESFVDNSDVVDEGKYDVADNYDYAEDETAKRGGLITMMKHGGVANYAGGGGAYYSEDDENGNRVLFYDDGSFETYDPDGNLIDSGEGRSIEAGDAVPNDGYYPYYDDERTINADGRGTKPGGSAPPPTKPVVDTGILNTIKTALGSPVGAAGAGALLASILGSGSSSGGQNQGLDMSKVGVINPRTTDFGIGPAKYVGYEDYGVAPDQGYVPNEELLRNLNAPGYNPVNEGDYGNAEPVKPMAAGGLSAMAPQATQTHYTFGTPVDPYSTLGLRPAPVAAAVDQQQMMPQNPPQGSPMPQRQGGMRRGGLSSLPMVEGRVDYRGGASVHGEGDGQSDDIPAMLADGEYVIDAETVAQIGNGSTKAGAKALNKFRENIRAHKRGAPIDKIPPKTKALTSYLKGA